MAAPAPIPPPIVLGLIIGAAGLVLYKMITGLSTPFTMSNGVNYWHKDQANAIKAELEGSHLEEIAGALRTFMVLPGAGAESALAAVKKMQAQMHVVTSSTNLLDLTSAQRFVAEVLPAEQATLTTGDVIAVLPAL